MGSFSGSPLCVWWKASQFCWQTVQRSSSSPLGQFGHGELRVPAIVSHIPIVGAEFGVFKAVAAHLGVLVVDGVNEDENDGDDYHGESHKSSDERKVVLCEENTINTF